METDKIFKNYVLTHFCEKYNTTRKEINQSHHLYFRYMCFKYNYFIKYVYIPKIKIQSCYEAVLIEFRNFPHVEFIIRNAILQLGSEWSHTIVCGKMNHKMILNIASNISENISIVLLDVDNMTQSEYSQLLMTADFWNRFYGEKLLIYQEDSFIFKKNMNDFLSFDYIGAPFSKDANDTPNLVGNGGFSLRSKSIMLEVIKINPIENTVFNSSTLNYMRDVSLEIAPEDVYFSKNMQEFGIGKVADWDSAFLFSTETINSIDSLGGHKFWLADDEWKKRIRQMYSLSEYVFHNDIIDYLKFNHMPPSFDKTKNIKNAFDIDLFFISKYYHLPYKSKKNVLNYIKSIGFHHSLYHPKQIVNLFPSICFYQFLKNLYVFYKSNIYTIQEFTNQYIYQVNYEDFVKKLIKKKYCNFNEKIDLLLLVFIGNEERGLDLIDRIIEYKKFENFNVSFCFNSVNILNSDKVKTKIKSSFTDYAIYFSNELGTDITSSLLMYYEISKKYNFDHIIKLHTKSITNHYNDLTDYLLKKPLRFVLSDKKAECNCIGHPDYYMNLCEDIFNQQLKEKFASQVISSHYFVAGTIFYTNKNVMNSVIEFVKKNDYHSYFLNNLYENNTINQDCSPIHFLERVFGTLRI